jgi:hypothetical protein
MVANMSGQAPRIGHYTNQNIDKDLIEQGYYALNKLRQTPVIRLQPWNPIPTPKSTTKPKRKRDRMRLARYYQALLESGKFESRAALARHLGVSRARVTQVLNRLKTVGEEPSKRA